MSLRPGLPPDSTKKYLFFRLRYLLASFYCPLSSLRFERTFIPAIWKSIFSLPTTFLSTSPLLLRISRPFLPFLFFRSDSGKGFYPQHSTTVLVLPVCSFITYITDSFLSASPLSFFSPGTSPLPFFYLHYFFRPSFLLSEFPVFKFQYHYLHLHFYIIGTFSPAYFLFYFFPIHHGFLSLSF